MRLGIISLHTYFRHNPVNSDIPYGERYSKVEINQPDRRNNRFHNYRSLTNYAKTNDILIALEIRYSEVKINQIKEIIEFVTNCRSLTN